MKSLFSVLFISALFVSGCRMAYFDIPTEEVVTEVNEGNHTYTVEVRTYEPIEITEVMSGPGSYSLRNDFVLSKMPQTKYKAKTLIFFLNEKKIVGDRLISIFSDTGLKFIF